MKIIDLNGDKIQACAVIPYRGYEISCSTIMNKNRSEIAVFFNDELVGSAHSVLGAMNIVDHKEGGK